jgi:hypothetical protein
LKGKRAAVFGDRPVWRLILGKTEAPFGILPDRARFRMSLCGILPLLAAAVGLILRPRKLFSLFISGP